jgi:hypothetical protein
MKTPCSFSLVQKPHPIQGSLFALLLFLLAGLISCGTNHSTAGQTNPHVHPIEVLTKQTDPCSLVTETQVEQVLKTPLTTDQRPTGSNNNSVQDSPCFYFSANFVTSAVIYLQTYQDAAAARTTFHRYYRYIMVVTVDGNTTPGNIHVTRRTISGLGDQALLIIAPSSPMLFVQKDNGILSVVVSNYGQPYSLAENEEQQLAQLAVRKM